ncbi:MAG: glycosyltransferase family protein [Bacteroidota bacterium]|nr:glycosyltransferase family protein [Bacteroidota bacterium]
MNGKKRILVAPLDWGIGHATRCIPIINALQSCNFEVIIAADGRPLHLLSNEFPNIEIIRMPGYNIKYSSFLPMSWNMLLQTPKILVNIKREKRILNQIVDDYNIDGVISDNRFGLYTDKVPAIFVTHQLQIQSTYFANSIRNLNYKYINKYSACWVVDDEKENLAGRLSKPKILPNNIIYIGTQSRFERKEQKRKYNFLAIVSGPEPQRTVLEKGLIKALKNRPERSLLLLGRPELKKKEQLGNLTVKSHLKAKDLNDAILQSELVISRPGYSTVMDLAKLEKQAIFIPTPGQTEQEYLAKNFMKKGICFAQKQNELDLNKAIVESRNYVGFSKVKNKTTDWKELFSIF